MPWEFVVYGKSEDQLIQVAPPHLSIGSIEVNQRKKSPDYCVGTFFRVSITVRSRGVGLFKRRPILGLPIETNDKRSPTGFSIQ